MSSPVKSQAIVLHLIRQGDSSAVVQVIDSLAGRQSLYVRRLGTGAVQAAMFHSLAVLDTVTSASPRSTLLYLREAQPLFTLEGLRTDICKSTTAMFICEVLHRTVRNDDGDSQLFSWLVESIVRFDAQTGSVANFHLWWMVSYCVRSGFRPQDNISEETPVFDMVSARFVPASENTQLWGEGQVFSREDSFLLHRLLNSTMEEALAIPLSAPRRLAFARKMLDYLSFHFGCSLDIKSLDVLHAIFS